MAKGGGFERTICKRLSLWWSGNKRDDVFWRATQSGGRATTRAKKGITTANSSGDICYLDIEGKLFIDKVILELKRGYNKKLKILDILDSNNKHFTLITWWNKIEHERVRQKRFNNWIIFRRDRKESCLVLTLRHLAEIEQYNGLWPHSLITINHNNISIVIIRFEEFLKWCDPETIKLLSDTAISKTKKIKRRKNVNKRTQTKKL